MMPKGSLLQETIAVRSKVVNKNVVQFKYNLINWLFWYLHINNNHRNYVNVVLFLSFDKAWRTGRRRVQANVLFVYSNGKICLRGIATDKRYTHMWCTLSGCCMCFDRIDFKYKRTRVNSMPVRNYAIVQCQWFIINAFIYEWFFCVCITNYE